MKVMFFIKSGRRCAASVFLLVGLVTTMNYVEGKSAARCEKNTGYNCGAVFPPGGDTCGQSGCCCNGDDGTGVRLNTCDNAKGYAYRGCDSCWEENACFKTNNVKIGDSSCHSYHSCRYVSDSTIDNNSCQGYQACKSVQNSFIHDGSCQGMNTCFGLKYATIGKGSCNADSNSNSSNHYGICEFLENVTIGNNSCNGGDVCHGCKHNVPDNACNQGITDDMDINGYCNYCVGSQGVVSSSTSKNKKSKSNKKQAAGPPKKK